MRRLFIALCALLIVALAWAGPPVAPGFPPIRQKLTAPLTLYVGGTYLNSSDSNNCLSFANQCATVQGAVNKAYNLYDTQGYTVTISICAACTATYSGAIVASGPLVGNGVLSIAGNGVPTITSTSSVGTITSQNGAQVSIQSISVTNTGTGADLNATVNGSMSIGSSVTLGSAGSMMSATTAGGVTTAALGFTIASGATAQAVFHVAALGNLNIDSATITCAGAVTVSLYFIGVGSAYAEAIGTTFSGCGSVTGPHFTANRDGAVRTNSACSAVATFFPGSAQGTVSANGVFDDYGSPTCQLTGAQLPTCIAGIKGIPALITDAAATPAYRGVATGGGSLQARVTCDGAGNWNYQ